jgi:hypothetical protein
MAAFFINMSFLPRPDALFIGPPCGLGFHWNNGPAAPAKQLFGLA